MIATPAPHIIRQFRSHQKTLFALIKITISWLGKREPWTAVPFILYLKKYPFSYILQNRILKKLLATISQKV